MAISTEQVVQILAKYIPGDIAATPEEAADELRQSLGEDTEAREILEAIANDFWELGYTAGMTVCAIAEDNLSAINGDLGTQNLPPVTAEQVRAILSWFGFKVGPV